MFFKILLVLNFHFLRGNAEVFLPDGDTHNLEIGHPGNYMKNKVEISLKEILNNNELIGYTATVPSVYCVDSVCKIDPVQLFWDPVGQYQQYKLDKKIKLEKTEGKPFTKDDHKQLHEILRDKNSRFRTIKIDDILTSRNQHDDVDGMTSATTLKLNDDETVMGAALTCFTLWHWANGEVVQKIEEITARNISTQRLINMLDQSDDAMMSFALHQLADRNVYKREVSNKVVEMVSGTQRELQKNILQYFEKGNSDTYLKAVFRMINDGKTDLRILVMMSVLNTEKKIEDAEFDQLAHYLPQLETYREVDLLLRIIENENPESLVAIEKAFSILDKDIFIARRAYWYLSERILTPEQQSVIKLFEQRNKDYL